MADRLAARGWPGWLIFCIGILCDFDTICSRWWWWRKGIKGKELEKKKRREKKERKKEGKISYFTQVSRDPNSFRRPHCAVRGLIIFFFLTFYLLYTLDDIWSCFISVIDLLIEQNKGILFCWHLLLVFSHYLMNNVFLTMNKKKKMKLWNFVLKIFENTSEIKLIPSSSQYNVFLE